MKRAFLKSVTFALLTAAAAAAQPAATGYLDVYSARVKPDKRPQFDAIAKKWAGANRAHNGDHWVTYEVSYGEQNTLYFVGTRADYAGVDTGMNAFIGAIKSSYGAGMDKMMADADSCLISSRSEIRTRRPDLSANLPADNAALSSVVGKSRFLRIVIVRTRPGHAAEWEAQERALKQAWERQLPGNILTVSQSSVGQALGNYYITSFGASIGALQPAKSLADLLGDRGYRDFNKATADTVIGTEIIIGRWLPELSNAPAEIASADPAFWNPKPPPAKAKAEEKK
ncbi:MAG TPA: hypothetical protein VEU96_04430 [Bryobacteraceae bacterium]|nr:hypothetical protein [Bryobacteraceae bacterium]